MSRNGEISDLVRTINACWVEGRYDDLREYFHEEMVLALSGFEQRISGAERIIDSYRAFGQKATIHEFTPREAQVDLFGSTAMTTTAFAIDYELEGRRYRRAAPTSCFSRRQPASGASGGAPSSRGRRTPASGL